MPKPNPNRVDRQKTIDASPPSSQGSRDAPGDTTDWIAVGHDEAESQRPKGEAVPTTQGTGAGGGGPKAPRSDS
jgi:hypothetical protein